MRELPMRQLFSLFPAIIPTAGAVLILSVTIISPLASTSLFAESGRSGAQAEPPASVLNQELQAARIVENAILSRISGREKTPEGKADLEKVSGIYEQIVKRNPQSAEALNALAEFLWKIEREPDAMANWERAEKLAPRDATVANHLGECHLELAHAKQATEYFERAAALEPGNALFQFNAGNTSYIFRHEITNATDDNNAVLRRSLEYFRRAAGNAPYNVDYARSYAETFYMVPDPDWKEALNAWKHFLEITDNKDFANLNLARVNLKLGRKEDANANLGAIKNEKFQALKNRMLRQTEGDQ